METQSIKSYEDVETADEYESRLANCRKEIVMILDLKSKGLIGQTRSLEVVMSEISQEAKERGLTPEILEELLKDQ